MSVIDDTLHGAIPKHRKTLEHVRSIIQQTVPNTQEVISYGIPTLDYKGKHLIHFASFKDHMSLFPGALTPEIQQKVDGFKISKGTIQFTAEHPIADDIIRDIALMRKAAIDAGKR